MRVTSIFGARKNKNKAKKETSLLPLPYCREQAIDLVAISVHRAAQPIDCGDLPVGGFFGGKRLGPILKQEIGRIAFEAVAGKVVFNFE